MQTYVVDRNSSTEMQESDIERIQDIYNGADMFLEYDPETRTGNVEIRVERHLISNFDFCLTNEGDFCGFEGFIDISMLFEMKQIIEIADATGSSPAFPFSALLDFLYLGRRETDVLRHAIFVRLRTNPFSVKFVNNFETNCLVVRNAEQNVILAVELTKGTRVMQHFEYTGTSEEKENILDIFSEVVRMLRGETRAMISVVIAVLELSL